MAKTTFPVTITGMNITDRGVAGKFGPQDKVGITIQETNVIDENGQNLVIPAGSWLNGFTPQGKMDQVAVGQQIPIQIKTKPNPNGGLYYNFGYYPKDVQPTPQATPGATAAETGDNYVTRQEFEKVVNSLEAQITELSNEISF